MEDQTVESTSSESECSDILVSNSNSDSGGLSKVVKSLHEISETEANEREFIDNHEQQQEEYVITSYSSDTEKDVSLRKRSNELLHIITDEEILPSSPKIIKLTTNNNDNDTRLHKLECEKRGLMESLLDTEESLLISEYHLDQTKDAIVNLNKKHDEIIKSLREELVKIKLECIYLLKDQAVLEHHIPCSTDTNIQQKVDDFTAELVIIRKQLQDKEQVEMKLLKANQTIYVLQNQIDSYIEDKKITILSKKKIDNYENMVYKIQVLEQENSSLKNRTSNLELVQYQLQTERDKCAGLEKKINTINKLDNETNKTDDQSSSSLLVALKYKLLDAQQREIILTRQCSELETKLKLANEENKQKQNKYNEIQRQLAMEKEEVIIKTDSLRRLERRLQFITKEREGCVNVLNSYKLDGGAESVLKEQVKELQETLIRYEAKISELEQENDELMAINSKNYRDKMSHQQL